MGRALVLMMFFVSVLYCGIKSKGLVGLPGDGRLMRILSLSSVRAGSGYDAMGII